MVIQPAKPQHLNVQELENAHLELWIFIDRGRNMAKKNKADQHKLRTGPGKSGHYIVSSIERSLMIEKKVPTCKKQSHSKS